MDSLLPSISFGIMNNDHINLDFIDHLSIAVEENRSEKVCEWYQTHFKFQRLDDIKIQTSYNGMLLKVYNFFTLGLAPYVETVSF